MRIDFGRVLDFVINLAASLSIGITYGSSVGLVTFIALSYLDEIKEAVKKGRSL